MGVFSFVKAGKKIFGAGKAIKSVKPNVPKTRLEKASRDLKIAKQKTKGAEAKLKQTTFELKNPKTKKDDKFTFGAKIGKSESNKERYKRIQKENTETIKKFIAPKDFNKGGRVGKMGGGMMSRRFGMNKGGKIPTTPKEKKFAALAPPRDRITYSDKIAGATGRQKAAIGGAAIGLKLGKAAMKFLKSKEGKKATKEIMDNPLPPKMQEQLKRLQKVVLLELEKVYPEGLTGSEIANKTGYSILSIRPRTTELKLQGLIIDTEKTRKNEGGKSEIIYQLRSLYVIEDYDLHKDKTDKK